jgi:HSP20 family molecular chaperone IbpA
METTNLTHREAAVVKGEGRRRGPLFVPRVDIFETAEAVVLVADLPGVDESSVEVTVDKRVLTIAGKVEPLSPAGYRLTYQEYRAADFHTQFRLSDAIDSDAIVATVKDGVLRIELRKADTARSRRIEVIAQ